MGTTGNAALRADLKNWFNNLNAFHVDRMEFTLDVFHMVKMLGFLVAARSPWTVNLRQGEMVHRVLGALRQRGCHSFDYVGGTPRPPATLADMRKPQRERPQSARGQKRPRMAPEAERRGGAQKVISRSRVCFNQK